MLLVLLLLVTALRERQPFVKVALYQRIIDDGETKNRQYQIQNSLIARVTPVPGSDLGRGLPPFVVTVVKINTARHQSQKDGNPGRSIDPLLSLRVMKSPRNCVQPVNRVEPTCHNTKYHTNRHTSSSHILQKLLNLFIDPLYINHLRL